MISVLMFVAMIYVTIDVSVALSAGVARDDIIGQVTVILKMFWVGLATLETFRNSKQF